MSLLTSRYTSCSLYLVSFVSPLKAVFLFFLIQACQGCKSPTSIPPAPPFDVEIHDMELCSVLATPEEGAASAEKLAQADTAMEEGEGEVDTEQPEGERRREGRGGGSEEEEVLVVEATETDIALAKDQEMASEEQEMTSSQTEQGKVTEMTH